MCRESFLLFALSFLKFSMMDEASLAEILFLFV